MLPLGVLDFFDSHRVNVMIIYCRTYGIPVDDKRGAVECFSILGITFSCFLAVGQIIFAHFFIPLR